MRYKKWDLLLWANGVDLDTTARVVLTCLVIAADVNNETPITRSTLSERLHLSEETIKKAVRRLRDARMVESVRVHRMWIYRVTPNCPVRRWHDLRPLPPVG